MLAGTWQGVVAVDRIEPRYSGLGSAPDFEFKGMRAAVDSIALWRGWMVVGAEGRIGVWQKVPQTILESTFNAHTWICIGWLEEHGAKVTLLGACGADGADARLVSMRSDGVVKVWTTGNTARTWTCERTITLHLPRVLCCLAVSSGAPSIVCGEMSGDVTVWDAASGVCHTTLTGHTSSVRVVWVDSDGLRMISAAQDRTIKVWDALSRVCVSTLDFGWRRDVHCMAVSEGMLLCGMKSTVVLGDRGSVVAVRVWDLNTLDEMVPIRTKTCCLVGENIDIKQLLVSRGEVWANVNNELVVWRAPGGWMDLLSMWNVLACMLLLVIMVQLKDTIYP